MKKGLIFILLLSMLLTGCQAPTEEVEVPRSSTIAEEKPAILPLEETDASSQPVSNESQSEETTVSTVPEQITQQQTQNDERVESESELTEATDKPQEADTPPATEELYGTETQESIPAVNVPVETEPETPESEPPASSQPVTEPEITEGTVTEQQTAEVEPEQTEPFDVGVWVGFAQGYAQSVGLNLDSAAVDCWDNPITAGAHSIYLERDICDRLNRYSRDEEITDVWIWAVDIGNGCYDLYIGYA